MKRHLTSPKRGVRTSTPSTARLLSSLAGLALAAGLVGCGDDGSPADAGPVDAGPVDLGPTDTGPADMGEPMPCDPVSGGGCPEGEFCVLDFPQDEGVCRTLPDMIGFGEACSTALQDCAPGLTCTLFQGDANGVCRQACRPENGNADCDGVPDDSQTYACSIVPEQGATFGVCEGTGSSGAECDPLSPLSCPAGETCSLVPGELSTACAPAGTTALGADCSQSNCDVGQGICINLGGDQLCYEPCDLANPSCTSATARCQGISANMMSLPFGLCLERDPGTQCDPVNPMCEPNQTCALVGGLDDTQCVPAGTARIGESCQGNQCAPDQGICINLGGSGATCYQTCALEGGTCPVGQTCGGLEDTSQDPPVVSSFGICN